MLRLVSLLQCSQGSLDALRALPALRQMNGSSNCLTGGIFPLANLSRLSRFDLSANALSGLVVPTLQRLPFLKFVAVDRNRFHDALITCSSLLLNDSCRDCILGAIRGKRQVRGT